MKQILIPAGVGYYVEFNGNLTGDFHRAIKPITATLERLDGTRVIFRLGDGRRGMTQRSLVVDLDVNTPGGAQ